VPSDLDTRQGREAASPAADCAIEAVDLRKSYGGRTVVAVEHLQVREGEVLAILGPNGAGKTTLFRLLALLETPDRGHVAYFGRRVRGLDLSARRRTAAVFQRPLLFQGSVQENVGFGLRFRRLSRAQAKVRVQRALELMQIGALAEADVRTLSGGEMQRVAIARALVLEPEILFLDEPTSNLDVHVRRRFREDLKRAVGHLAATVVIITHEHSEALALAHRVAVLQEGTVVQVGTPEEVFTQPRDAFVADFAGAETIWHGRVTTCRDGLCLVRTEAGIEAQVVCEAAPGTPVAVAIRPEDVALAAGAPAPGPGGGAAAPALGAFHSEGALGARAVTSVRNRWPGTVLSLSPAGPLVRVVVKLDSDSPGPAVFGGEGEVISVITRASADELALVPGARVTTSVKATALQVMTG
jgi:molybdopterin-binding protein